MKDELNIIEMFNGLSRDEAEKLTARIKAAVENEYKYFKQGVTVNIDESVFDKLVNFPRWKEGDGPAPYVFADRPAGHRCAWSCHWATTNPANERSPVVIVRPEDWGFADPGRMDALQVAAELEDNIYHMLFLAQPFGGVGNERGFTVSMKINVELPYGANDLIKRLVGDFRKNYTRTRAYINPYSPPAGMMVREDKRPGWAKE